MFMPCETCVLKSDGCSCTVADIVIQKINELTNAGKDAVQVERVKDCDEIAAGLLEGAIVIAISPKFVYNYKGKEDSGEQSIPSGDSAAE